MQMAPDFISTSSYVNVGGMVAAVYNAPEKQAGNDPEIMPYKVINRIFTTLSGNYAI